MIFSSPGKHPVSALQEICAKKHWDPPHYELVTDTGPSHHMSFCYKVVRTDYSKPNFPFLLSPLFAGDIAYWVFSASCSKCQQEASQTSSCPRLLTGTWIYRECLVNSSLLSRMRIYVKGEACDAQCICAHMRMQRTYTYVCTCIRGQE